MFVRSPFNYDGDVVSHKTGLDCSDSEDRCQQHFRDETDINVLVQRFINTGVPDAPPAPAMADFDQVFDYQSAMNTLIDAQKAFGALPSKIRTRFQNDPHQFLSFIHDSDNRDEAIRLGLIPKPVVSQQPVTTVTSTDSSDSSSSSS